MSWRYLFILTFSYIQSTFRYLNDDDIHILVV